jgi:hypothetical protein
VVDQKPAEAGSQFTIILTVLCYPIRQGNYPIVYSIQEDVLTVWIVKIGRPREVHRQVNWRSQFVTSKIKPISVKSK